MDRPRNDQQTDDAADDEQKFISLPYIKGTSEILKRIFATHKIKCSFYSKETLRKHLSKPKDLVELDKKATLYTKFLAKIAMFSILVKQKYLSKLEQTSIKKQLKTKMLIKMKLRTIVGKMIMK